MGAVVADTHTIIWYLRKPGKLSPRALQALRSASEQGEPVYVSAISLVEATYLVEKGKIPEEALSRLESVLTNPASGIREVAVDLPVTRSLREVSRQAVPDMPDRIIAATARHLHLPLVSRDGQIRASNIDTIW